MNVHNVRRSLVAAALAGTALAAVPSVAGAASTCGGVDGFGRLTINDGSGPSALRITRSGQQIAFHDSAGPLFACNGPQGLASVLNTRSVVVVHASAADAAGGVIVDQSGGAFAPGLEVESDGTSEIEVLVGGGAVNPPPTQLEVTGTEGANTIRATSAGGVMLGTDNDVDVRARGATSITINGRGGSDFISGRGDHPGTSRPAANVPLTLRGGIGLDTLVDGLSTDALFGDDDGDTLFSVDSAADRFSGGAGFDSATIDSRDRALDSTTDQVTLGSVGKLDLSPAVVRAKAGKVAHLTLRWTHPVVWKKLRTVEARLYDGTELVGKIAAQPKSGRLTGDLLAGGSQLTRRGKTVTAQLALRIPKALAGQQLRVAVEATDRQGHRQVEPSAGLIQTAK